MIVCPLTSSKLLEAELNLAAEKRPDFLEFRTDSLALSAFGRVAGFAAEKGVGIVLTWKPASSDPELGALTAFLESADAAARRFINWIDIDSGVFLQLLAKAGLADDRLPGKEISGERLEDARFAKDLKRLVRTLREYGASLILSCHDFELKEAFLTPMNTLLRTAEAVRLALISCLLSDPLLSSELRLSPAPEVEVIPKFAFAPASKEVADAFVRKCRELQHERRLIAVPMGEYGRQARLQLYRRGSLLSYAYLLRPNAPGQPSIDEYRGCTSTNAVPLDD